jgi:hypothetical protein
MTFKTMAGGLLLLALAGWLAAPRTGAQEPTDADAVRSRILALEKAWNQAEQQKDSLALKALLGPEMVYIDYDGTLMNKSEYLASVKLPSRDAAKIVNESMSVQIYRGVAVASASIGKAAR